MAAACDTTAEVGDRVVIEVPQIEWARQDCGTTFPVLVGKQEARSTARYLVDCPNRDEPVPVARVRRAVALERTLLLASVGVKLLVWLTFVVAMAGVLIRDPFGLRRAREAISRIKADIAERTAAGASTGDGLPGLAPLQCSRCGAPAPLVEAASVPCPSCGTPVPTPEDYREVARLRGRATSAHQRAARLWRLHALLHSPRAWTVVRALGWILVPILALGYLFGIIYGTLGAVYRIFGLVVLGGGALVLSGRLGRLVLPAALRTEIGPLTLPAPDSAHGGACRTCGAPVRLASLAQAIVVCGYCGTEHLLARRAHRARAVAHAQTGRATASLLDATTSLEASVTRLWRAIRLFAIAIVVVTSTYVAVTGGIEIAC